LPRRVNAGDTPIFLENSITFFVLKVKEMGVLSDITFVHLVFGYIKKSSKGGKPG
jgi:hypothetical protein